MKLPALRGSYPGMWILSLSLTSWETWGSPTPVRRTHPGETLASFSENLETTSRRMEFKVTVKGEGGWSHSRSTHGVQHSSTSGIVGLGEPLVGLISTPFSEPVRKCL